ncbi:MAG: YicC family protein [Opitutales bacterium]|nr:YicC family protein [Opitutales bacterium]
MKSMTGYGRAEITLPGFHGVIELSSVNKRGFEFLLHGPKEWQFFEREAQKLIRSLVQRGRIRLSILLQPQVISAEDPSRDQEARVGDKLDELKRICFSQDLPYSPSVDLIQRILTSGSRDPVVPTLDSIENMLIDKTNIALNQMVSMRGKEGESLAKDLKKRAYGLGETVHSVEKNTEGLAREWRDRLLQRLKESGLDINCDDDAVRKEFTVYAEKSDVSEEITRVRSHLEQFEEGLQTKQPIGRKLEFIVQELGREFNTLGSKSLTPTISNLVIEAKVEIEKIREQVMNLE